MPGSRQYRELEDHLLTPETFDGLRDRCELPVAVEPDIDTYLAARKVTLNERLSAVAALAEADHLEGVTLTGRDLRFAPVRTGGPRAAERLAGRLYAMLPTVRNGHRWCVRSCFRPVSFAQFSLRTSRSEYLGSAFVLVRPGRRVSGSGGADCWTHQRAADSRTMAGDSATRHVNPAGHGLPPRWYFDVSGHTRSGTTWRRRYANSGALSVRCSPLIGSRIRCFAAAHRAS